MRAYYATKISTNISKMPNGFLLCKNVPIARTGTQDYKGFELGINDRPDDLFQVHRSEDEVFDIAALASFEGVSFVDEHPSIDVTADNAAIYSRGFVKDVRRGEGADNDKVVADIIVTDVNAIAEIENGKREISCGYICDYKTDDDGKIYQCNIRGNHVALVGRGRAGQTVAIKDAKPLNIQNLNNERKTKFMNSKTKAEDTKAKGILSKFFSSLSTDANPDDVAEIAEQLVESLEEAVEQAEDDAGVEITKEIVDPAEIKKDEATNEDKVMAMLMELSRDINEIKSRVDGMNSTDKKDSDPLDELEKMVSGEESVTKPVEEMDEIAEDEENPALDNGIVEPAGKETGSTATADQIHDAIVTAKKTVAEIKDANTRKIVSDSMAKLIRQTYGITPTTPKGSYSTILKIKQNNANKANDAAIPFDNMDDRQAAYNSRNPHINKQGGTQ